MLGGLGGRAALEAMQPKRRKCERCGLHYRETLDKCRWCGDLDEAGLAKLKETLENEHASHSSLGKIFLVVAAIILVLVLLI
jgi:uncharacterized membrane protein YvbJ